MGYAFYTLPDGREAGYGVEATCDREGCDAKIDRGLGYLCGEHPDGRRDPSEPGCGRYFCGPHGSTVAHDCPNPYGVQRHVFRRSALEPGTCGTVITDDHDSRFEQECGAPEDKHEPAA